MPIQASPGQAVGIKKSRSETRGAVDAVDEVNIGVERAVIGHWRGIERAIAIDVQVGAVGRKGDMDPLAERQSRVLYHRANCAAARVPDVATIFSAAS